jgi:hypothetical protein
MRKLAILAAIAAISFDIHFAIADDVPTYDVRKTCKADVQSYPSAGNVQGCLRDEQDARTTLVSQWMQFAADNRARCTRMVGDPAGPQSYVELLTCLQMARDVKTAPKN